MFRFCLCGDPKPLNSCCQASTDKSGQYATVQADIDTRYVHIRGLNNRIVDFCVHIHDP